MRKRTVTHSRLVELLAYEAETGLFRWRLTRRGSKEGSVAGCISADGYTRISIDCRNYTAHRLAWMYEQGDFPNAGLQIDHINGNRSDNRKENLRLVTNSENQQNRHKKSSWATSKTLGVHWDKRRNSWQAMITLNKKTMFLGRFKSEQDAIKARKDAEKIHFISMGANYLEVNNEQRT